MIKPSSAFVFLVSSLLGAATPCLAGSFPMQVIARDAQAKSFLDSVKPLQLTNEDPETLNLTLQMGEPGAFSILDNDGAEKPLSDAATHKLFAAIARVAPESLKPKGEVFSRVQVECRRIVAMDHGPKGPLICRFSWTVHGMYGLE